MNKHTVALLQQHFDTAFAAPNGVKKLRELILTLAMQGKLVAQDPNDQPACQLLREIEAGKQQLVKEGKIKAPKPLPPIKREEFPYTLPGSESWRASSVFHRHPGRDCRGPEAMDGNEELSHPCDLDSGNPCRNDGINPGHWVWVRLGDCMLKITDGTHHSPINTEHGDFLYISAKNIKDDGVLIDNATFVTKAIHDEIYSRCDPEYGDILYIKDGATTGIVTINNLHEPFSMLSSVALLKQPKQIYSRYLLSALRSPFFYNEMRAGMTGVAITRVTLKKLNEAIIPLPPISEQHRIVAKIEQLMARCDKLEKLRTEREQRRLTVHAAAINQLTSPTASFPRIPSRAQGRESMTAENLASRPCAPEGMQGNDDGMDSLNVSAPQTPSTALTSIR